MVHFIFVRKYDKMAIGKCDYIVSGNSNCFIALCRTEFVIVDIRGPYSICVYCIFFTNCVSIMNILSYFEIVDRARFADELR